MGNADSEGGYACVGQKVYRKSLELPLNFAVNQELF